MAAGSRGTSAEQSWQVEEDVAGRNAPAPSAAPRHCPLQEWQVCQVTVGVLGDVCRAIEEQVRCC